MVKFGKGAWIILTMLWFIEASAADDSGRCYSIKNPDLRAACLAETRKSSSRCYSIRNADRRRLCLAQTTGQKSRCYGIRDNDLRNACLAGMDR